MKKILITALAGVLSAMTVFGQSKRQDRPNILIIMTDQHTADAMSIAGNKDLKTPSIDFLAQNGTRFTEAYCVQPLCTPSRISIFSGQRPIHTGFTGNVEERDGLWPDSLLVMGKIFKDAGYKTGYVGKWHLPIPTTKISQHGFDYIQNTAPGDFLDAANPSFCARFMKEHKNDPFLLVASFLNPHDICEWARNDQLKMDFIGTPPPPEQCPLLPANWRIAPNEPLIIREQQKVNTKTYPSTQWDADKWRQYRWAYNQLVEKVDNYIGMVLAGLKKYGLEDNTIIIFTSDHGDGYAAHQWNQKQVLYQESAKVPFIVSKIGQWKEKTDNNLICNGIDIMPTICSFAGIKTPSYLKSGVDIKQVIEKPGTKLRDTLVIETDFADNTRLLGIKGRAIITHQYKYIAYDKGDLREQLFDLTVDPGETNNLAVQTKYKKTLNGMRAYMKKWARENNDTFNSGK
ncbi:sulfatase [Pseudopedobacter beijingensis]|uniref:Sulfatase n=1 Tax=Pseudopedobacter beijingensis TaxID=1207056 RepID=A0ABW4IEU9_9SPHI